MTTVAPETTAPERVTVETREVYEPGDHDRMSHYAPRDKIMEAMVEGVAITALCGKQWVPTRDGTKFPVCPECHEIWESLPPGE